MMKNNDSNTFKIRKAGSLHTVRIRPGSRNSNLHGNQTPDKREYSRTSKEEINIKDMLRKVPKTL